MYIDIQCCSIRRASDLSDLSFAARLGDWFVGGKYVPRRSGSPLTWIRQIKGYELAKR